MTGNGLYGVVLWMDGAKGTAIIWCEDQGDLAYVTPDSDGTHNVGAIEPGDLIVFHLDPEETGYRRACNPRRVQESSHQALPRMLVRDARTGAGTEPGNVVPLGRASRRTDNKSYVA